MKTSFYEYVIFDYPELHMIDYSKNTVLAVDTKTSKAHYFYYINEDISCHFHLLAETGNYEKWFLKSIKKHGIDVNTFESDTEYYETLTIKGEKIARIFNIKAEFNSCKLNYQVFAKNAKEALNSIIDHFEVNTKVINISIKNLSD